MIIKTEVRATEVLRKLRVMAREVDNTRVPNKRLAAQFQSWALRNFNSSGQNVGGWAPLAPSTLAQKKRLGYSRKPLLRTGALRGSLLAFYDDRQAGVGSEMKISEYHEHGTSRMPQRRLIPTREEALEMALDVYQHYVETSQRKAAL